MQYLHTMIRVTDPDATIAFFELLGLREVRRLENEKGRFTLIFLATEADMNGPGERAKAEVELTYNWDPEEYGSGRNFGHLGLRQVAEIGQPQQRAADAIAAEEHRVEPGLCAEARCQSVPHAGHQHGPLTWVGESSTKGGAAHARNRTAHDVPAAGPCADSSDSLTNARASAPD